ncbi:MAG: metal-dependent transcriptional regulator, partial [Turicibacter sp.]|nr:metal-dependent transcriptional regulator [Turicibacter sp.]
MRNEFRESSEDYLEAILMLSFDGAVRSVDVANQLNFTRSSVSIAMKKLKESNLIEINDGYIKLTPTGKKIAETVYERHTFIANWLISLGIERQTAITDACRIEHVISEQSFLAIKKYLQNQDLGALPQTPLGASPQT